MRTNDDHHAAALDANSDGARTIADRAQDIVERHRTTVERFTYVGWFAKGVVYVLFGLAAVSIARGSSGSGSGDEASPKGALGQVIDLPGGRFLLAVLALGLALYSIWRFASVLFVRGEDLAAWGDRIGYTFSAVFYVVLSVTAVSAASSGNEPDQSSTVESLSTTLLENSVGRWLLGFGGVVTIAVGLYFAVRKGLMRSFTEDVAGVDDELGSNRGLDRAILIGGIGGWIGRGVATTLVGWFVLRSAIEFDPDEARGFDRALRETAEGSTGNVLVWISAVGLVAYGVFCLFTARRRTLGDSS